MQAGIEAALRAGMKGIGVGKNSSALDASLKVDTLSRLPADAFSSLLKH